MEGKHYCKKNRHFHRESLRLTGLSDEKLVRNLINCPDICCAFCERRANCDWVCREVTLHEKPPMIWKGCEWLCTIQDKVFGKILRKQERDVF